MVAGNSHAAAPAATPEPAKDDSHSEEKEGKVLKEEAEPKTAEEEAEPKTAEAKKMPRKKHSLKEARNEVKKKEPNVAQSSGVQKAASEARRGPSPMTAKHQRQTEVSGPPQ